MSHSGFVCNSVSHYFGAVGVKHQKEMQDSTSSPERRYIRKIIEIPHSEIPDKDESDEVDETCGSGEDPLRIIICMTPEGSRRLRQAQFIQSDIAFRRVVGFQEFELAALDRVHNVGECFGF